jgi:hypothetical protein
MKSKSLPKHALRVTDYCGLRNYAQAFAQKKLSCLMVLGPPGVGKSSCLRQAMQGAAHWIEGNATPFGIYQAALEHCDEPLVLDDVDAFHCCRNGVRLLKSLCQTEFKKTVSWNSDGRSLDQRGLPRSFTTTSPVAIIANDWKSSNPDVAALEDRAHVIVFEPNPLAVHLEAAQWFWDQEVFDYVGQHLHLVEQHSLRVYRRAWEAKQAGLEWRRLVLAGLLPEKVLLAARLKADSCYKTEEERVAAFAAAGGGCRATYFKCAKMLNASQGAPVITLSHMAPPVAEVDAPDILPFEQAVRGQARS